MQSNLEEISESFIAGILVLKDFMNFPSWFFSKEESYKIASQRISTLCFSLQPNFGENINIISVGNFDSVYVNSGVKEQKKLPNIFLYLNIADLTKVLHPSESKLIEVLEGYMPMMYVHFSYRSKAEAKEVLKMLKKEFVILSDRNGLLQIIKTEMPSQKEELGNEVLRDFGIDIFESALKDKHGISLCYSRFP